MATLKDPIVRCMEESTSRARTNGRTRSGETTCTELPGNMWTRSRPRRAGGQRNNNWKGTVTISLLALAVHCGVDCQKKELKNPRLRVQSTRGGRGRTSDGLGGAAHWQFDDCESKKRMWTAQRFGKVAWEQEDRPSVPSGGPGGV